MPARVKKLYDSLKKYSIDKSWPALTPTQIDENNRITSEVITTLNEALHSSSTKPFVAAFIAQEKSALEEKAPSLVEFLAKLEGISYETLMLVFSNIPDDVWLKEEKVERTYFYREADRFTDVPHYRLNAVLNNLNNKSLSPAEKKQLNFYLTTQRKLNPIQSLDALYHYLDNLPALHSPQDIIFIEAYLTEAFRQNDPAFLAAFNAKERQAMTNGKKSLSHLLLEKRLFSIEFAKLVLSQWTDETLTHESRPLYAISKHEVNTSLAMAITGLSERNVTPEQQIAWRDNIIDYLLDDRGISPDRGYLTCGSPLTEHCLLMYTKNLVDGTLYLPLIKKMIAKSSNVNQQHKAFGTTPLHFAAAFNLCDFVEALLAKGADVTLKGRNGLFEATAKTPLLFATERGSMDAARLLLKAGASPNEMPVNPCYQVAAFREERVLTPFQTAVAQRNKDFVDLFKKDAAKKKARLESTLDPNEQAKRDSLGIFQPKGDATLAERAHAQTIRSPANLLATLKNKYNIRCYVADPKDRNNVEEALTWLLEITPESPVYPYWGPVKEAFLQRSAADPDFAIFIGDASHAVGCFNNDTGNEFYIKGGEPLEDLKHIIAHEIGHFFATTQFGRKGMIPKDFEELFALDRKDYQKSANYLLNYLINEVALLKNTYNDHFKIMAEYFTRACVQFPIMLHQKMPNLSKEAFKQILEQSMPNTLKYMALNWCNQSSFAKKSKALR